MQLRDLMVAVKEPHLTKTQLEEYRTLLANLSAEMQLEKADIEKKEALYLIADSADTHVARKRAWKATADGQRLIELDNHVRAVNKLYDSVKSRLFSIY